MRDKKRQEKEQRLLKDLRDLNGAVQVLRRRRGQLFNSGERCQELLDEESKVLRELTDLTENNQREGRK